MENNQAIESGKWFLLHRTGGVWDVIFGTADEVAGEVARRNASDAGGCTEVQSVHDSSHEALSAWEAQQP